MRTATRNVDGEGCTSGWRRLFGPGDADIRGETVDNGNRVDEALGVWRRDGKRDLRREVMGVESGVEASVWGDKYVAEKGMMASQSTSSFPYPCPLPLALSREPFSPPTNASNMSGFAPGLTEPSRNVGGGIHVPFRMASSTMRR